MADQLTRALIDASDAIGRLGDDNVVFLDASWTYPGGPQPRTTRVIPGSIRFDIDDVAEPGSRLPHTLPSPDVFSEKVSALGISNATQVIAYDRMGVFTAPRVWWMFRVMGHDRVQVLNGGMPAWIDADGPVTDVTSQPVAPGGFKAAFRPHLYAATEDVKAGTVSAGTSILDARSAARFAGHAAEPRPGMRAGHMPGAVSLPYTCLVDENGYLDTCLLPAALATNDENSIITTCGSGVTACIISLALYERGKDSRVYDGSWSEWGSRDDLPVETGRGAEL